MLKEKDRQIEILAEQVDYLRAQLAFKGQGVAPLPSGNLADVVVPQDLPTMKAQPWVSDEELDIQAMLDSKEITEDQVREVMQAFGLDAFGDVDIDLA